MENNDLVQVRRKSRSYARMYLREVITLDEAEYGFTEVLHGSTRAVFGADPEVVIDPDVVAALAEEVRLAAAEFNEPDMSDAIVTAVERAVESHYWFANVWYTVYRTVLGTFELVWQEGGMTDQQRVEQVELYNRLIREGVDGYYDWHALRYLLGGAEFGYFVDDLDLPDEVLASYHMDQKALEVWRSSDRNYRQAISMVSFVKSAHKEAAERAAADE